MRKGLIGAILCKFIKPTDKQCQRAWANRQQLTGGPQRFDIRMEFLLSETALNSSRKTQTMANVVWFRDEKWTFLVAAYK